MLKKLLLFFIAAFAKGKEFATSVKIKPVRNTFILPTKASDGSAAYDAFVPEPVRLHTGRMIIPLGFAIEFPDYLALDCRTRAGYAAKGLKVYDEYGNDRDENGKEYRIEAEVVLGLIDSDYRGEVGAILHVTDKWVDERPFYVARRQAIGQLKFCFVPETKWEIVKELSDTSRGSNGFGKHNNE